LFLRDWRNPWVGGGSEGAVEAHPDKSRPPPIKL
jgi:hypothetical protein